MLFSDLKTTPYKLINLIFAGIILLIFIYSAVFKPEKSNHSIPSESKLFWKHDSQSTGLSRSFSSIIRLNFSEARSYNQYGIQLFIFFLIQFAMRVFFIVIFGRFKYMERNRIIIIDSIVSVLTHIKLL